MESKKIQGKYNIPRNRDFKHKDHEDLVAGKLRLMKTLDFFEVIGKLDFGQTDYLGFYRVYLKEFSKEQYPNSIKRRQFELLAKELKLFDHLQQLEALTKEKSVSNKPLKFFIKDRVDRMFIDKEIERVLDENFLKVFKDIDELVQREYVACTGKQPKKAVFDKQKMGDNISESLEKEEAIAKHFIKEYRKKPSRELADAYRKQHEIPTFEQVSAVAERQLFDEPWEEPEELFSSYPVEMVED